MIPISTNNPGMVPFAYNLSCAEEVSKNPGQKPDGKKHETLSEIITNAQRVSDGFKW
jgi:hypothetical protein